MADGYLGADDGTSSPELRQAALDADILHLVGQCRAYLLDLEGYLGSIGNLQDERATRVVEALELTLAEQPGTLRHVEQVATDLLRTLTELVETVRPK